MSPESLLTCTFDRWGALGDVGRVRSSCGLSADQVRTVGAAAHHRLMRLFGWLSVGSSGPRVGVGVSRRFGQRRSVSPGIAHAANVILAVCVLVALVLVVL